MPNICYYILIGLCCIQVVSAQTAIRGTVRDEAGDAVPNCSILLKSGQGIIKFASSDQSGSFSFMVSDQLRLDSCVLEANHLSYKSKTLALSSGIFQYEIILSIRSNLMDEIRIGRPPIQQRTDTLRFDVAYFAGVADRSIGDVLRNMPGIEVDDNGRIKYNGQAISDFYIDGDDLMGSRYGVATKVVPHEMIQAIEVIRNHQKIKALEDKVFSDNVAMNLVVKNDRKMDLSGQAKLGAGLPAQYDGEINAILFNKKIKMLHTLSGNNAGKDLGNLQRDLVNMAEAPAGGSTMLSTGTNRINPADFSSFHANQSANLLSNVMFSLADNWKVRTNLGIYIDRLRRNTHDRTRYFSSDGIIENEESAIVCFLPLETQGEFHFSKNEKEKYLSNTLSALFRNQDTRNELSVGNFAFTGNLNQRFWKIKNDFSFIPRPKESGTWHYNLSIDSRRTPERLSFSPVDLLSLAADIRDGAQTLGQEFTHTRHLGKAGIQYIPNSSRAWFRQSYTVEADAGQEGIQSHLWTDLHPTIQDSRFQNNLNWQQYQLQASGSYTLQFTRILLRTILPFAWRDIYWEDSMHDFSNSYKKLLVTPSFNIRYDLSSRQNLQLTYYRTQQTGKIWNLYRGAVMVDYLTFRNSRSALPYLITDIAEARYSVESIPHMLFYKLGYQFSSTYSNILGTKNVGNQQIEIGVVNTGNRIESQAINTSISKFINVLSGKVSLSGEIQQRRMSQLFNGQLLSTKTNMLSLQPSINAQASRQLKLSYEGDMLWARTSPGDGSDRKEKNSSSTHRMQGVYSASENLHFKTTAQYLSMGLDDISYTQLRLNGSIRYKSRKTKLEYECILSNMTNARDFRYTYIDENYSIEKYQQLRGRMVLLKVGFNF